MSSQEGIVCVTANTSKAQLKIIVDGDACPGKDIIARVAKEFNIEVVWIASLEHQGKFIDEFKYIVVDNYPQATDMAVVKNVTRGDIVITQDYGLAALVLSKGAKAISPRGMVYSEGNIDRLLLQRHIDAKIRRGGGKTKGPKSMSMDTFISFEKNLRVLIFN